MFAAKRYTKNQINIVAYIHNLVIFTGGVKCHTQIILNT